MGEYAFVGIGLWHGVGRATPIDNNPFPVFPCIRGMQDIAGFKFKPANLSTQPGNHLWPTLRGSLQESAEVAER